MPFKQCKETCLPVRSPTLVLQPESPMEFQRSPVRRAGGKGPCLQSSEILPQCRFAFPFLHRLPHPRLPPSSRSWPLHKRPSCRLPKAASLSELLFSLGVWNNTHCCLAAALGKRSIPCLPKCKAVFAGLSKRHTHPC